MKYLKNDENTKLPKLSYSIMAQTAFHTFFCLKRGVVSCI